MTRRSKSVITLLIFIALAAFLVWRFLPMGGKGEEREISAPTGPAAQAGVVTLSREMLESAGIKTETPKPYVYREQTHAYVTVLDTGDLVDLRKNYLAAKAEGQKAGAALETTRAEYSRMKKLYDEKNVSPKAYQAAEAAFRADESDYELAKGNIQAIEFGASQKLGNALAGGVWNETPAFFRLETRRDVLLQVTLPQDYVSNAPPAGLKIIAPSGKTITARFISLTPRTNPQIQGISFFYAAPAKTGLLPGMNASAVFPTGRPVSGLFIPASAVVWWQGRAWAYIEAGEQTAGQVTLTRREVSTENPVDGGWFVSGGFSPTDKIVVKGAETLLSQEFLAKPAGGNGGDED